MSIIFHHKIKSTPKLQEIIKNAPTVSLSELRERQEDNNDDIIIIQDSADSIGRADVLMSKKSFSNDAYEILDNFKEAQRMKNDITGNNEVESDEYFNRRIETCVDGCKIRTFEEKGNGYLEAELTSNNGDILLNANFNIGSITGDSVIVKEYRKTLNGKEPSIHSFREFVKTKELEYVENNKEEVIAKTEKIKSEIDELLSKRKKECENEKVESHPLTADEIDEIYHPWKKQQFYRIIGKEELTKLLNGETIINIRPGRVGIDITNNPDYHRIFYGEEKYRIPFKKIDSNGDKFTSRVREVEPTEDHFSVGSYDINDVDIKNIARWNGSDWEKV